MNVADFFRRAWENKAHLITIGTTGAGGIKQAMSDDGKVSPREGVGIAKAVALASLEEYGASDHVVAHITRDQSARSQVIQAAVMDVKRHADLAIADGELTARETVEIAAYAGDRLLQAIDELDELPLASQVEADQAPEGE